ncbi:MAG: hypothetical protein J6M02_00810 [Clostridia bacterium]|nr:hypothetical protein [Clostridia bacterium]
MRKYLILITSILSFLLLIVLLCVYYAGKLQPTPTAQSVSTEDILAHSEWIPLSSKDIDLLSSEIYTENVNRIISSLESGTPVILYVEDGIFDKAGKGNYITLSAFDTKGNVIVYEKKEETFQKSSVDFYLALEAASSAFIITNEESLS